MNQATAMDLQEANIWRCFVTQGYKKTHNGAFWKTLANDFLAPKLSIKADDEKI